MEKYLDIIKESALFNGLNEDEIKSILTCLSVSIKNFSKKEIIVQSGDNIHDIGVVLSGAVHILHYDSWGNCNIIAKIEASKIFAEAYACLQNKTANINIIATTATTIMFINLERMVTTCSSACVFHSRLIRNLLSVLALKNMQMNEKLMHIIQRSTKEKILSYLVNESQLQKSLSFDIPFNRQQLADYLAVERSALSNELSKMKSKGLIDFNKNHFTLLIDEKTEVHF